MYITDDYSFGTTASMLDCMTDDEAKEYFESVEADYRIDEISQTF